MQSAGRPFLGTYKLGAKDRIVAIEDGKLLYRGPRKRRPELVPVGRNRLRSA